MEKTTIENTGAPAGKVDETIAEGKTVAADSKDQEPDFQLIDSLHSAATDHVDIAKFKEHDKHLDQILTPSGNTILHLYIISRPLKTSELLKCTKKSKKATEFVKGVLGMCPNLLFKANEKGEYPLHFAARYGHCNIVEVLLEEGKQLDHKDQEKGFKTIRQMLEKTNESKDTALHEAVRYNHTDVVNKLIDADTEVPYGANDSGETPLYLAAERGYKKVVEKILKDCKSAAADGPMGRTALHAAVIRKDKVMAERLLEMSRKKDELGRFALHYAAFLGCEEIVEELLNKYPSAAYQADNDGKTALHLAAGNGKAKAVNKLIEKCPNCCELVDKRGCNALHLALTSADISTIKIFLDNPALGNLINQKDDEGNTPLLQLANSGSDISTFIYHPKVDKLVFNKENKSAEDIILAKDLIMDEQDPFIRRLKKTEGYPCSRVIVPKPEIKEAKVNQSSTISIETVNYGKAKDEGSEDIERKIKDAGGTHLVVKVKDEGSEDIEKKIKDAGGTHLVVATLIATVTFAAGFTLPGGYLPKDNPNEGTSPSPSPSPSSEDENAGAALLHGSPPFQAFIVFDTAAFALSCAAVLVHLTIGLHKDKTQLCKQFVRELKLTSFAMVAMVFAFITGIYAVLYPNKSLAITTCVIGCLFGAFFYRQAKKDVGKMMVSSVFQGLSNLKKKATNIGRNCHRLR